jgi:tetratricopeptide (TPR) repeat protein
MPRKFRREALPDSPDPIGIAMVAAVSGKPIPDVAKRVLEEQAELIHAQVAELRLKHVGDIVRAVLWAFLAVGALAIVILLGALVYHAARSDSLIVESFRVPPAMESQGLSGEVVAKEVLDKIAAFDQSTQSARSASSYDNNWGDDLKIDIPNTGATADQVWKLLRGWLGKETRISGEVIQTSDGLALTTRVGSNPGQRFVSKTSDLDSLVSQGAVAIYEKTQPYRSAIYLLRNGRVAEGRALLQKLSADASPRERKWAFVGLAWDARNAGHIHYATQLYRRAMAIDPKMLNAVDGLAITEFALGHEQLAADVAAPFLKLPIGSEYDPTNAKALQCNAEQSLAFWIRDPVLADAAADCFDAAPDSGSASSARATAQIARHDRQPLVAYREPVNPAFEEVERAESEAEARLYGQMERGPSPALARALQDFRGGVAAEIANPIFGLGYQQSELTYYWPLEAQALVELGRTDEAAALIAKTPLDCYDCIRTRGMVAEAQRNAAEAERWFVEAVRQGPRLPAAYVDWGRLLIHAHHFDAAIPKLARAAQLSPNWADPLKYWGDVLAAEGKRSDALAKYDAALKLAPDWEELKQTQARLRHAA